MPNYCNNSAKFTGPTDRIQELHIGAQCGNMQAGLLHSIIPQPELEEDQDDSKVFPGWYRWRVANWGTKWDVECYSIELTDNGDGTSTLEVSFDSAWSPPIDAYQVLVDEGITVEAMYNEPGMTYAGTFNNKFGESTIDYGACDSSNVREFVGTVLDDKFCIAEFLAECEEAG